MSSQSAGMGKGGGGIRQVRGGGNFGRRKMMGGISRMVVAAGSVSEGSELVRVRSGGGVGILNISVLYFKQGTVVRWWST